MKEEERIKESLANKISEASKLDQRLQEIASATKKMSKLPIIASDELLDGHCLAHALGLSAAEQPMDEAEDFVLLLAKEALEDPDPNLEHPDSWTDIKTLQFPGQTWLKQAYFLQHAIQTEMKEVNKEYQKVAKKSEEMKKKRDRLQARKRQRDEKTVEHFCHAASPGRKAKQLSRRNQINRIRKGVKKLKRRRENDERGKEAWVLPRAYVIAHWGGGY